MLTRKTIMVALGVISAGAAACQNNTPGTSSTSSTEAPATPATANNNANAPSPNTVTNTNATIAADPLAQAENKEQVKQYADEYHFTPARPAKMVTGFSTQVRSAPSGDAITTVETVDNVTEVARDAKGNYYLVLYPDPKDATKQLAGWVYRGALENTAWSQTTPPSGKALATTQGAKLACERGQVHLRTDRDFCAKSCKDDKGCDKDKAEICDGLAFEVNDTTGKQTNARYCIAESSPSANNAHGAEHGTSKPLEQAR